MARDKSNATEAPTQALTERNQRWMKSDGGCKGPATPESRHPLLRSISCCAICRVHVYNVASCCLNFEHEDSRLIGTLARHSKVLLTSCRQHYLLEVSTGTSNFEVISVEEASPFSLLSAGHDRKVWPFHVDTKKSM